MRNVWGRLCGRSYDLRELWEKQSNLSQSKLMRQRGIFESKIWERIEIMAGHLSQLEFELYSMGKRES